MSRDPQLDAVMKDYAACWSPPKSVRKAGRQNGAGRDNPSSDDLGEWDAGDDSGPIEPRGWLLGNVFCRKFGSSIIAEGGVGKTALRYAQYMSLAIGRSLTGEHVFQRCRVLVVSLEDDREELRRRIEAVRLHYGIAREDLKGWLFLAAPGRRAGKLMTVDDKGRTAIGPLAEKLENTITDRRIDLVGIDPFVKSHSVEENGNGAIDEVVQVLTDLAHKFNVAFDAPHHASKGASDPGNANRGRGASAMRDAMRLFFTLTPMTPEEAQTFGVPEVERVRLIRLDNAKVNIVPKAADATWFRLVGVKLGNGTDLYPNGDEVQTVERWIPPDVFRDLPVTTINRILDDIEAGLPDGNRYSNAPNAEDRAAWRVITKHCPTKPEGQARQIINKWVKSQLLTNQPYKNPLNRKEVKGLSVNNSRRPTGCSFGG